MVNNHSRLHAYQKTMMEKEENGAVWSEMNWFSFFGWIDFRSWTPGEGYRQALNLLLDSDVETENWVI